MNKILAIATITIRSSIRSRVVLAMLLMLLAVIIGLPLTVKGDGTLSGEIQILLTYTLGLVALILSLLTMWTGCATISQEISERQIHLVIAKPVYRYQIWVGKWLGLLALNGLLLSISAGTVYGLLRWTTRASQLTPSEEAVLSRDVLVARERIQPNLPDVKDEARERFENQFSAGALLSGLSTPNALKAMEQAILTRRYSAANSDSLHWTFHASKAPPDHPFHLQFQFSTSNQSVKKVKGLWRISGENSLEVFEQEIGSVPSGVHTLVIPPHVIYGSETLHVRYTNINDNPLRVLFEPDDGIVLFVYRGGFFGNLFRSILILFFHITFLAALGITAGSLFSMPVASFVSIFAMVLLQSAGYIESMSTRNLLTPSELNGNEPAIINILFGYSFKALQFMVSPLEMANPLESIGVGELVPWTWVGTDCLIQVVLYCGLFGTLGSWLFNRREIGLPS